MRACRIIFFFLLAAVSIPLPAQDGEDGIVVDYNNPKKYKVGGVTVEGNNYFSDRQIIQLTGLQKGMEVTVPGDDMSSIVNRLWMQR